MVISLRTTEDNLVKATLENTCFILMCTQCNFSVQAVNEKGPKLILMVVLQN